MEYRRHLWCLATDMPKRKSLEISEPLASYGLPISIFSLICALVVDALIFVPVPNVQAADMTCIDTTTNLTRLHSALQLWSRRAEDLFIHFFRPFVDDISHPNCPLGIQEQGSAKGKVLSARPWFCRPFRRVSVSNCSPLQGRKMQTHLTAPADRRSIPTKTTSA